MVTAVNQIPFNSNLTAEQKQQRRQQTQEVAVGVGTAGVTAQVGTARGTTLRNMYEKVVRTSKLTAQNKDVATGLWANLVRNTKRFSEHAMTKLKAFENVKIIGPIIKSPITKKLTGAFGAVTAVFVLISGLSEASRNGKITVADIRQRLDMAA